MMNDPALVGANAAELTSANRIIVLLVAWRAFKRSHDIEDAKVACCGKTLALFAALDELERDILHSPPQ